MPVLLLVLQLPPREAVGLSVLASVGYLISLAAYRYTYSGVAWGATLALALGSLAGGLVGAVTVDLIPALIVKRIIGVMTIIAGLALLIPWKD